MYDLFYKLQALQQAGIAVHLHCFTYNRSPQKELEQYCVSVQYYPRKTGVKGMNFSLPYIVAGRRSKALLKALLKDDYPILMEGISCTYPLLDKRFSHRKLFVRLHYVACAYYFHLAEHAGSFFKRAYYLAESILLKQYERHIANKANAFLAVSYKDAAIYTNAFNCKNAHYLPLFLPPWQVAGEMGKGTYCIYHGNLEVKENEEAAIWLITTVFSNLDIPLVIAGKNPSPRLLQIISATGNTRIFINPSPAEMDTLIAKAHIQVLPSFNATGIKIKLLNALYNGRHCIVNSAAVAGTGLEALCHVADTAPDMQQLITILFEQAFTKEDLDERKAILYQHFDNAAGAQQIKKVIWGEI